MYETIRYDITRHMFVKVYQFKKKTTQLNIINIKSLLLYEIHITSAFTNLYDFSIETTI